MSKATNFYKTSPQWARGVIVVAVVALTLAAIWTGYGLISNAIKKAKENETPKEADAELEKLRTQGIVPTYTDAQYKIWADAIEEAFQGWGTANGDTVFINLKNDADVLKLIIAFGVRTISSGAWNP